MTINTRVTNWQWMGVTGCGLQYDVIVIILKIEIVVHSAVSGKFSTSN